MNLENNLTLDKSFKTQLLSIFILYFLIHIPFLFNGYGVEEDSWGLVVNAKEMFDTKSYIASRLPGHPVHEFILYFLYPFSPFKYNIVSAIAASISIFFTALFFNQIKLQQPLLATLAVAFCPVLFIAGTYTIDYTLSLMFLMMAWYLLAKNKFYWAAITLAFAVSTRITNSALIIPMIFFIGFKKENFKIIFFFCIVSGVASLLLFSPSIYKYGLAFFDYSDQFPYPNFPKFIYKATFGVFGFIGCVSLLLIFVSKKNHKTTVASYVTIVIILLLIAYVKLPQKSAYLIPIIPFLIILYGTKLSSKLFSIFCASLIISGWAFGINLVDSSRGSETNSNLCFKIAGQTIAFSPFTGNIIGDYYKRNIKNNYVQKVLNKTDSIVKPTAIIAGWWYNQVYIESLNSKKNKNLHLVFYCNKDSLKSMKENKFKIYFLEEQNIYNDLMFKMHETENYASSFY